MQEKNKIIGISSNDFKYLQILFDEKYLELLNMQKSKTKINLPPEMTIGIEIESCGRSKDAIAALINKFFKNWNVDKDSSIQPDKTHEDGTEITSPVFIRTNKKIQEKL